ncbi:MAG: hypothetical protein RLZZ584_2375 [Pseudomonadota bacterium]
MLKTLGISTYMWLFFAAYFHLLRHPASPTTVMPLTALDLAIPFQPGWLWAYLSLWFYTGIAPGLVMTLRELAHYGAWIAGLCLTGLACFYLWPTAVPQQIDGAVTATGFSLLQGVDAAGNACPSLHVATAMYSAYWIDRLLRTVAAPGVLRVVNVSWVGAITWSTLAIKQHVVWDVLAGTLLACVFALLARRSSLGLLYAGQRKSS